MLFPGSPVERCPCGRNRPSEIGAPGEIRSTGLTCSLNDLALVCLACAHPMAHAFPTGTQFQFEIGMNFVGGIIAWHTTIPRAVALYLTLAHALSVSVWQR